MQESRTFFLKTRCTKNKDHMMKIIQLRRTNCNYIEHGFDLSKEKSSDRLTERKFVMLKNSLSF